MNLIELGCESQIDVYEMGPLLMIMVSMKLEPKNYIITLETVLTILQAKRRYSMQQTQEGITPNCRRNGSNRYRRNWNAKKP